MNSHLHPIFSSALNSFAKAQQEPAPDRYAELVAALAPFAEAAPRYSSAHPDCRILTDNFTLGQARAAQRAISDSTRPATLAEKDAALKRAQDLISKAVDALQAETEGRQPQYISDLIADLRSGLDQIEEAL